MFKAVWIRCKLSQSIPWEHRPFYSLIADPAAGTVTVVAQTPHLGQPGIWKTNVGPTKLPSAGWLSKHQRHKAFFRFIRAFKSLLDLFRSWDIVVSKTFFHQLKKRMAHRRLTWYLENHSDRMFCELRLDPALKSSIHTEELTRPFYVQPPVLLYTTWMAVSLQCGFDVTMNDDFWSSLKVQQPEEIRFVVDIDMNMEKPTPLAPKWPKFVLFALGIGANAYGEGLQLTGPDSVGPDFVDSHGRTILHASQVSDQWFIKFTDQGRVYNSGLSYTHQFSIRRALAWGNVMIVKRRESWFCWGLGQEGMAPLDSIEISSDLSSWMILQANSNIPPSGPEPYPGPTELPLYRPPARITGDDPESHQDPLATAIMWLFYDDGCGTTEELLPISQRLQETRERGLCFLQQLDRIQSLESKVHKLLVVDSEQEKPSPARSEHEKSTTKIDVADQVLESLRKAFSSSAYLSKSSELYETLLRISEAFDKRDSPTARLLVNLKESQSIKVKAFEAQISLLETILDRGPLVPESGDRREVLIDFGLLAFNPMFKMLKSSYDPHDSGLATEKIELGDNSDETTLLAHILLSLANWEGSQREPWALDDFAFLLVEQIRSTFEALLANHLPRSEYKKAVNSFKVVIDQGLKDAERGLYKAPALPLNDLLKKSERTVYLL